MQKAVMLVVMALMPAWSLAEALVKPFTGEINAAYLRSSGSTNKETIKGRFDTQYVHKAWAHQLKAEAINESDNDSGQRNAERYLAMEKSSWDFTPADYIFIKSQYEKDQQTNYDYQALIATGYGRKAIKTQTMLLNMDAGAGTRYSRDDSTGKTDNEAVANLALKYEWKFRQGGRFTEDASMDAGENSTVMHTRSALVFDLTDVLGFSVAYETKSDDGPSDINDTLTTLGLNYRIK